MGNWKKRTESLKEWFESKAKPPLQALRRDDVIQSMDLDVQSLEKKAEREDDLFQIALLGQSKVGKSTLINTLVADTGFVVPSGGGDGPMTATALRVRYGEKPRFSVFYHPKSKINKLRFVLETMLAREKKNFIPEANVSDCDDDNSLEEYNLGTDDDKSRQNNDIQKSAKQILGYSHDSEISLEYLIDALRSIQGLKFLFHTKFDDSQNEFIKQVKSAIELRSKSKWKIFESDDLTEFRRSLKNHASGQLAPMIDEMHIEWPSELLKQGIEIVDLPGVGVQSDHYEKVTSDFLKYKARAVMLVTNGSGLTRVDAEVLKTSGFLDRILFSMDKPEEDPVSILVAVSHIDDVAYQNSLHDEEDNLGIPVFTIEQHFNKVVESIQSVIKTGLKSFLEAAWKDSDGILQSDKIDAINRIMSSLAIAPVSAIQYRKILLQRPQDPPFLPNEESTRIPFLKKTIGDLAANWFEERQNRFKLQEKSFFDFVGSRLISEGAAIEESLSGESQSDQLLEELNQFIQPHKEQFQVRMGRFGNFLNSAIRERIRAGVLEAADLARKQMLAYVNTLTEYPWNTLRAAVRRSGTFVGARRVNLRSEFSAAFISPMASVWSTKILSEIRSQTNIFAESQENAVREVIGWARSNKLRPSTRLLDALAEEIKQNRIRLVGVGRNAVNELREKVRENLYESVQVPIDSECRKFVRRGNDEGAGVKARIHRLLYELVEKVADELKVTVESLLLEQFRVVAREIREALRDDYNPLDDAIERLIPRIESVSQKEIEKRKGILASINQAVESIPSFSDKSANAA